MLDKYLIDYHKLMFHPERLALWLGFSVLTKITTDKRNAWGPVKKLYPIYVEISLAGICNHRCQFCALDYLGYRAGFANFKNLKKAIRDMANGGVKSINFSGEGEPLLYPKAEEMIRYAKFLGLDVALVTNGTFLKKELLENILPSLNWLKVSIDAGTAQTHLKIHRPEVQDFDIILNNLKKTVRIRNQKKHKCSLGGQIILLPDNCKEIIILAEKLKKIGLDYLVVKSYSQHPKSLTRKYENISYKKYLYLKPQLEKLNTGKFQVIFREETMKKLEKKRSYKTCNAVPFFWAHLMTNGDIYTCGNFLGNKRFKLGNYNEKTFKEIWESEKRKKHWKFIQNGIDISQCRKNCRMDEANKYLEKLRNPPQHVNFI